MRRTLLAAIVVMVPVSALAQPRDARLSEGAALPEGVVAPAVALSTTSAVLQPASPTAVYHRRPSMTAGVVDGTISSRVGARVDAGTSLIAIDRAEFFTAKCGCYRDYAPTSALYDPDAPGPARVETADVLQFHLFGEYALGTRFSVIADVPVRRFTPGTNAANLGETSGVSDVRAGVKIGLGSDGRSRFTLRALASAPTGDAGRGLGTHHWSFDGVTTYERQFGNRGGFEAEFGTVVPFQGSRGVPVVGSSSFAGKVLYWGVGPSIDVWQRGTSRVAPVVEALGWRVLDGFSTAFGPNSVPTNIVDVAAGVRVVLHDRHSLYGGWSHAVTDARWFKDTVRVEYRREL